VVDDGSTDNGWRIVCDYMEINECYWPPEGLERPEIEAFATTDKFLGYKLNRNYGPSLARNIAIRGWINLCDIFAFLDADDLYGPSKISKSVQILLDNLYVGPGNPGVGVVYSDYINWNSTEGWKRQECKPSFPAKNF
jgi:glycosyltransferase involved in cell wall biosynthesis